MDWGLSDFWREFMAVAFRTIEELIEILESRKVKAELQAKRDDGFEPATSSTPMHNSTWLNYAFASYPFLTFVVSAETSAAPPPTNQL